MSPIDKTPWTDETPMPWGKHKGVPLGQVPPDYLLWCYGKNWIKDWPGLYAYLKENEMALIQDDQEEQRDTEIEMSTWDDYMRDR